MHFAIAVYDALVAIDVPAEKAKAVVTALEHDMTTELATKSDLNHLEVALKADLGHMRTEFKSEVKHLSETFDLKLKAMGNTIVIRLTAVMVAVVGLAATFHRLF